MMTDDEKFVLLVQSREIIYNSRLKEHRNRNIVDHNWKEVAEEMNMSVTECKNKWTNLRNSFARHLRNQSKPSGLGDAKSRWYLAEAMSFLEDHMQQRKQKGNSDKELEEQETIQQVIRDVETSYSDENSEAVQELSMKRPSTSNLRKKVLSKRPLPSEHVVGPMIEFLKSKTNKQVEEHPLVDFMKILIPDYNSLTPRRQRIFRQKIVTTMNELMDEQEEETSSTSSRSFTQLTCSNSDSASGETKLSYL